MDPDLPRPGQVIASKYEVEQVLGAGGMGVVVAARHAQLGQRVAIKFMRGHMAQDAGAVERFLREARAAVALTSEHVARVLDVGTLESGAPYMVMEHLSGMDLEHLVSRDGPMPVTAAVGIVLQASEAIAEAHSLGLVHRDLKPANLFVTSRMDGSRLVKVLDFGISKAAQAEGAAGAQNLTASGVAMGSPAYMSPEQVRNAKGVDARSDIWSLGVILYELVSGVSPFMGESLGDTFAKIVSESPIPLRERRPDVPPEFVAIVDQCLQRKVDARIQTVGQLASRLSRFAPKDAAISVERIQRISGQARAGTLAAPETMLAPSVDAQPPFGTEQSWNRSSTAADRPKGPLYLIAIGAAVVVVAGGAAAYHFATASSHASVASVPASNEPSAPSSMPSASPSLGALPPVPSSLGASTPSAAISEELTPSPPSEPKSDSVDAGHSSVSLTTKHVPPPVPKAPTSKPVNSARNPAAPPTASREIDVF